MLSEFEVNRLVTQARMAEGLGPYLHHPLRGNATAGYSAIPREILRMVSDAYAAGHAAAMRTQRTKFADLDYSDVEARVAAAMVSDSDNPDAWYGNGQPGSRIKGVSP